MLNSVKSYLLPASMAIGFSTNTVRVIIHDLLSCLPSGSVYITADHTAIYCVGETVGLAIDRLNKASGECFNWCALLNL